MKFGEKLQKLRKENGLSQEQLAEKLNPKNKAYKGGHFEKKENQSFMSRLSVFVRGNFFIPDARKFWVNPSAEYLKDFFEGDDLGV